MGNEKVYFTDEECRLFTERVMDMGQEWYQYMHGEHEEANSPTTILKRHLQLFDGDWIGLIDFDMEMQVWSTKYFYNAKTGSDSKTLIGEAENMEQAARWVNAIQTGTPIIIRDIEEIKDSVPEEYDMYKRLKVKSVLGVPYRNCSSGLMVVRNPKNFGDNYVALNIMSYIATNELIAYRRKQNIERHTVKYQADSAEKVLINLFGNFEIHSKDLYLSADDVTLPMQFMIAYLCCSKQKFLSQEKLYDIYGDENISWKNQVYRFRKLWKDAEGHESNDLQLIVTTDKGYAINSKLDIVVDANYAIEMVKLIEDQSDVKNKIEMLKVFLGYYRGDFLAQHIEAHSFISEKRLKYRAMFNSKMEDLLKYLYGLRKYESLEGYSADFLEICPESTGIYVWRAAALNALNKKESLNDTLDTAKAVLEHNEYKSLCSRLLKITKAEMLPGIVDQGRRDFKSELEQIVPRSWLASSGLSFILPRI